MVVALRPKLSVTVSVTVYMPAAAYVCVGARPSAASVVSRTSAVSLAGSPKSQRQWTIDPPSVDRSAKATGAPAIGDGVIVAAPASRNVDDS